MKSYDTSGRSSRYFPIFFFVINALTSAKTFALRDLKKKKGKCRIRRNHGQEGISKINDLDLIIYDNFDSFLKSIEFRMLCKKLLSTTSVLKNHKYHYSSGQI